MSDSIVPHLTARLDDLSQRLPEDGIEFWFARDLMEPLGYSRWENFTTAIQRAIESCKSTGYNEDDHFRGVTKMVSVGSGAERPVEDFMLTRYACYLIAQNGDPRKQAIAFAQSYFAVQTRKQELIEGRIGKAGEVNATSPKRNDSLIFYNKVVGFLPTIENWFSPQVPVQVPVCPKEGCQLVRRTCHIRPALPFTFVRCSPVRVVRRRAVLSPVSASLK